MNISQRSRPSYDPAYDDALETKAEKRRAAAVRKQRVRLAVSHAQKLSATKADERAAAVRKQRARLAILRARSLGVS